MTTPRRIATRDFPQHVKDAVTRRMGGVYCPVCREHGLVTPPDEPMVLDHMQPLSQGGTNDHWNMQWMCESHNLAKGDRAAPSVASAKFPAWSRRRNDSTRR